MMKTECTAPEPEDMAPEVNQEFWEQDENNPDAQVDYFWITECPCSESCSQESFKRASCWSLISPDKCYCYLVRHLMYSGKHQLSLEAAQIEAAKAECQHDMTVLPAPEVKRQKRQGQQMGKGSKRPKQQDWNSSWSGGWNDTGRQSDALQVDLTAATAPVQTLAPGLLPTMPPNLSPSQALVRQTNTEEQKITFRLSHVRLIHDAITRASTATTQLSEIMAHFQSQYKNEERVLNEAQRLLGNYLAAAGQK